MRGFFAKLNEDSLLLNTVRIHILKSPDTSYHLQLIRFSHGNTTRAALDMAARIRFAPIQSDSIVLLPRGFTLGEDQNSGINRYWWRSPFLWVRRSGWTRPGPLSLVQYRCQPAPYAFRQFT